MTVLVAGGSPLPKTTMRNIRTLSGAFGLGFLVNYVFYGAQKNER